MYPLTAADITKLLNMVNYFKPCDVELAEKLKAMKSRQESREFVNA